MLQALRDYNISAFVELCSSQCCSAVQLFLLEKAKLTEDDIRILVGFLTGFTDRGHEIDPDYFGCLQPNLQVI